MRCKAAREIAYGMRLPLLLIANRTRFPFQCGSKVGAPCQNAFMSRQSMFIGWIPSQVASGVASPGQVERSPRFWSFEISRTNALRDKSQCSRGDYSIIGRSDSRSSGVTPGNYNENLAKYS